MDLASIRIITQAIANFSTIIVAPIMTFLVARKLYIEYKETNQLNIVRLLILGIFIAFSWAIIPTNLVESTDLKYVVDINVIGWNLFTITPYSIAIGVMVTLSLCLIAYANRWETFYYAPLFIFGGVLIFYVLTGFSAWYQYFVLLCGIIGLVFFYITGFRLKDNGSLGLGVFFTFSYISVIFGETIPGDIFTILIAVFGLIFTLGYFTPFKEKEEV